MKRIGFISDFFKDDLLGGGEINDNNLIDHLGSFCDVKKYHSKAAKVEYLNELDSIIIANFTMLSPAVMAYLMSDNKPYLIYEHDHKYVNTRDPSKFKDFQIPEANVINKRFYEKASNVVVLSNVCKEVMGNTIPKATIHNIGCSLWSQETFDLIARHNKREKINDLCIMRNSNPTKNYFNTLQYCRRNKLDFGEIKPADQNGFLSQMSEYKRLLFIPTVLETFSRLCAEAKMLNLDVMTNRSMIGFFSEESSNLKGDELIDCMKEKNKEALSFFEEAV